MNNYYETCLVKLVQCIDQGKIREARQILDQEMSMPYIPEPYYTKFLEIQDALPVVRRQSHQGLDFDEIVESLSSESQFKMQALVSLQTMNLHPYVDALKELLESNRLEDIVKKHILICCVEQKIDMQVSMEINGKRLNLSVLDIEDPFDKFEYKEIVGELSNVFENQNPSMYLISLELLKSYVFETYPLWNSELSAAGIIEALEDLMGCDASLA